MIKNRSGFHFISNAWLCFKWIFLFFDRKLACKRSHFFSLIFFSGIRRGDQSHHRRCQSCWSKRLDPSQFSAAFLIRLFTLDQTQAWGSLGNSRAVPRDESFLLAVCAAFPPPCGFGREESRESYPPAEAGRTSSAEVQAGLDVEAVLPVGGIHRK